MKLFGDANDLLNENKGYVKQSDFTATWHILSVFKQFLLHARTFCKSHLNRAMQTLMSPNKKPGEKPVSYAIIKSFSKCKTA